MEKTKIDVEEQIVYGERYYPFVLWAVVALIAMLLLRHLYLRQIP